MSPKKLSRIKPRKRKTPKILLGIFFLGIPLVLLVFAIGYWFIVARSSVVSPLPVTLGKLVPIIRSGNDEAELQGLLHKHTIMYTAIARNGEDFVISLNPKQEVILTRKKNLATQISSLQMILPRLTMEGKQFKRLDLRYDKPIVVY